METVRHKHVLTIDMRINTHIKNSTETQHAQIHKAHGLLFFCMEVNMLHSHNYNKHYKWN